MDAVDHNGAAQEIFWVKHALPLCILCVQDGGVAQPRVAAALLSAIVHCLLSHRKCHCEVDQGQPVLVLWS